MRNTYDLTDKYTLEILAVVHDDFMAESLLKNFIGPSHMTPYGIIYHDSPQYEPLNTGGRVLVMFTLYGEKHAATDYMYIPEDDPNSTQALIDELYNRGINLRSEDD